MTEEQAVLLVNHTYKMLAGSRLTVDDERYPIRQFYRYRNPAHLTGANKTGVMKVEFAVLVRVEFIPDGAERGPLKDIYFKIFQKGSCGIVGAVFGWPTLDHPQFPGDEGLGWINKRDGVEYSALGVTIPRLDDHRKQCYFNSCQLYKNSSGQLLKVDDESKDECNLIRATQDMRAATMMVDNVPTAKMEIPCCRTST